MSMPKYRINPCLGGVRYFAVFIDKNMSETLISLFI